MLWGYFASTGALVKVNGFMNFTQYQDISAQNLVASVRRLKLSCKWIFQQHNNPKHTLKSTKKWFIGYKTDISQWPSQSPDLKLL
jgi:hypothetical protein